MTGLTTTQLNIVFPYHLLVNHNFEIVQVGPKIDSLVKRNESGESNLIGKLVYDYFTISSPPRFQWKWKNIEMSKDSTFNVDFIPTDLLKRENMNTLPLRGFILILDSKNDPTLQESMILFLLNPRVSCCDQLKAGGFTLSDLSKYSLQKEIMVTTEHLNCELQVGSKLEISRKNLKIEKLEAERMKTQKILETKCAFVRYVSHEIRTPLNILLMGLNLLYDKQLLYEAATAATTTTVSSACPSPDSRSNNTNNSNSKDEQTSLLLSHSAKLKQKLLLTMSPRHNNTINTTSTTMDDHDNHGTKNQDIDNSMQYSPLYHPHPHHSTTNTPNTRTIHIASLLWSPSSEDSGEQMTSYLSPSQQGKSFFNSLTSPSNKLKSPSNALTSPSNALTLPSNRLTSPSNALTSPSNRLTSPLETSRFTSIIETLDILAPSMISDDLDIIKQVVSEDDSNNPSYLLSSSNQSEDVLEDNKILIQDMISAGNSAVSILNDLLLYEKIEGKLLHMETKECCVHDIIQSVFQLFSIQAKATNINLTSHIDATVSVYAKVDVHKFSVVIRNLISNGLKFTPEFGNVDIYTHVIKKNGDRRVSLNQSTTMSEDLTINNNNNNNMKKVVPPTPRSPIPSSSKRQLSFELATAAVGAASNIGIVGTGTTASAGMSFSQGPTSTTTSPRPIMTKVTAINTTKESFLSEEQQQHISSLSSVVDENQFYLRMQVKDSGIGISKEEQSHLFQEFVQIRPNKLQNGGGSGLGLWVARSIMEAHGGTIGVYSEGEIGHGSIFYIDIPIMRIQAQSTLLSTRIIPIRIPLSTHNSINITTATTSATTSATTPTATNNKNIASTNTITNSEIIRNSDIRLSDLSISDKNTLDVHDNTITCTVSTMKHTHINQPPSSSQDNTYTHTHLASDYHSEISALSHDMASHLTTSTTTIDHNISTPPTPPTTNNNNDNNDNHYNRIYRKSTPDSIQEMSVESLHETPRPIHDTFIAPVYETTATVTAAATSMSTTRLSPIPISIQIDTPITDTNTNKELNKELLISNNNSTVSFNTSRENVLTLIDPTSGLSTNSSNSNIIADSIVNNKLVDSITASLITVPNTTTINDTNTPTQSFGYSENLLGDLLEPQSPTTTTTQTTSSNTTTISMSTNTIPRSTSKSSLMSTSTPMKIKSILIVDDSIMNTKLVCHHLRHKIPHIDLAKDGVEAIYKYHEFMIHSQISDNNNTSNSSNNNNNNNGNNSSRYGGMKSYNSSDTLMSDSSPKINNNHNIPNSGNNTPNFRKPPSVPLIYNPLIRNQYDVIMMDSVMPKMNGIQTVKMLRKLGYTGLIVGVTGNSLQSDIDEFLSAGVNKVMIKPINMDIFYDYALDWLNNNNNNTARKGS